MELHEMQRRLREAGRRKGAPGRGRLAGLVPERARIALAADHGGYLLKENLKGYLEELGHAVEDLGTSSRDPVDYPDFALAVARKVVSGSCALGIVIDGAGIGSCMTANKVRGVRAATCHDEATTRNSREHNNANVLCLGAGVLTAGHARRLVRLWLQTDFAGGRHGRRVDKIDALDRDR